MAPPIADDYLVERRRLRHSLSLWRVAAFGLLMLGVVFTGLRYFSPGGGVGSFGPHIARLAIEGVITGDRETLKLIKSIEESPASAVLISIDSPGGTTTGAERLYEALRHLSSKKPTAAVVGTLAASGGYIAALGADQIIAQGNSLVGSIGVLVEFPNFAKLFDTLGVKVEEVKSSPLKAAPNGFEPTSPEARAALASLVGDSFSWFKSLVKERRALSDQQLAVVDDGRVFTGRQGLDLHLVDRLGGEDAAIAWLVEAKGVHAGLPVRDWKRSRSLERLDILGFSAELADFAGLTRLSQFLSGASRYEASHSLDGLVSIWQVSNIN